MIDLQDFLCGSHHEMMRPMLADLHFAFPRTMIPEAFTCWGMFLFFRLAWVGMMARTQAACGVFALEVRDQSNLQIS
jgi:hypothetical protein